MGGNSAKASSGINGCCPKHSRSEANAADSIDAFAADTARSAKRDKAGLLYLLADKSASAIDWLLERTSIDLSKLAQLGGHSHPRTHRPANGMVGAELTFALHKELKAYAARGQLSLRTGCRVTNFLVDGDGASSRVVGVRYIDERSGEAVELRTPQTVLATGGFANDRTNSSLLVKHRPDLVSYPTTNGVWATGDGMKIAMAIGAGSVDMDRVQVHPTGFIDPLKPAAPTKTLCGEMMRGVGGILVAPDGRRFVNELAPRDKVVDGQLATGASEFALVLSQVGGPTPRARHTRMHRPCDASQAAAAGPTPPSARCLQCGAHAPRSHDACAPPPHTHAPSLVYGRSRWPRRRGGTSSSTRRRG